MTKTAPPSRTKETMDQLLRKEDLTVTEAAELLRVNAVTVYRMIDNNELDYWRKTAKSGIRIYTASVIKYIRNVQGRVLESGHPKK